MSKALQAALDAVGPQSNCAGYQKQVFLWIADSNVAAVQGVLDTEVSLKLAGYPHSQFLIDTCTRWLSESTFNNLAIAGHA